LHKKIRATAKIMVERARRSDCSGHVFAFFIPYFPILAAPFKKTAALNCCRTPRSLEAQLNTKGSH